MVLNQYRHFCETCNSYVLTWALTDPGVCPNNATHTLTSTTGVIVLSLAEAHPVDADSKPFYVIRSGKLEYTTQWITRGDDPAGSTVKRNAGNSTLLCTKAASPGLMVESKALTDSDTDGGLGSFKANALAHYVFSNQVPLSFYSGIYGGSNWKRKRVRIQFMDNLQCKAMWMHWHNGKPGRIFGHAFVFMHNYGTKPDWTKLTPYNTSAAHDDSTNPVGWLVGTYSEEVPLIGSCEGGIDFTAEDCSAELYTGTADYHMMELWSELTYDADSFTESDVCSMFVRLMAYSEKNIDEAW